jgi:small subunit ribosomal protein S1
MKKYYPEGTLINTSENSYYLKSIFNMQESMNQGRILEAKQLCATTIITLLLICHVQKELFHVIEGAIGIADGSTKDIALITKVNKPVASRLHKL